MSKHEQTRRVSLFRCRLFSLVEAVLAIGIMAVGLVALMRLFPVGLAADRDAIGHTYAAEAADFFLQLYVTHLKSHTPDSDKWETLGLALPTDKPGDGEPTDWTAWDETGNVAIWKTPSNPGFWKIEQRVPTSRVADFAAVCRVWRENVVCWDCPDGTWQQRALTSDMAMALNLEVSWPANLPLSRRRTALYRIEVFKPTAP